MTDVSDHPSDSTNHRLILVVEDDEDTRETLCTALELNGFATLSANNGEQALRTLRECQRPCLILLDLMMPVMSGLEFLESLRQDPAYDTTPVVLVSAWPEDAKQMAGAQGVVGKPFDLHQLLARIESLC